MAGPWITLALRAADKEYRERIGNEDDGDGSGRTRVAGLETRALCKAGDEGLETEIQSGSWGRGCEL
jgi:hypothetical protein